MIDKGNWAKIDQSVAKKKSDNAGREIPVEHKWSDQRMSQLWEWALPPSETGVQPEELTDVKKSVVTKKDGVPVYGSNAGQTLDRMPGNSQGSFMALIQQRIKG